MAGRQFGPPPSVVQEFNHVWRDWLNLVFGKIHKRTFSIELQATNSVSPSSNPMVDGVVGVGPVALADDTTDESRHFAFAIPLDWVAGSDLTVKTYFVNVGLQSGANTVITKLTYNAFTSEELANGSGATLTDTVTLTTDIAANTYHVSGDLTIPATALALGDTVFLQLIRDATTDTCTGDVGYQLIVIEYTGYMNHE